MNLLQKPKHPITSGNPQTSGNSTLTAREHASTRFRPFGLLAIAAALMLAPSLACRTARPAARLEMISVESGRQFEQTFSAAVFERGPRGELDVVLVDQTAGLSRTTDAPGKPLQATQAAPLTHLMHVNVLWRPTRVMRPRSPSSSNATVHWAVLSRDGGRLDYTGTGFVRVIGGGEKVRVELRGVRLMPVKRQGELADPVGAVTLTSFFTARRDPETVQTALEMIHHANEPPSAAAPANAPPAGAASPDSGYDGPPARAPGP